MYRTHASEQVQRLSNSQTSGDTREVKVSEIFVRKWYRALWRTDSRINLGACAVPADRSGDDDRYLDTVVACSGQGAEVTRCLLSTVQIKRVLIHARVEWCVADPLCSERYFRGQGSNPGHLTSKPGTPNSGPRQTTTEAQ